MFEMTELASYDFIYTVGSVRVSGLRSVTNKDGNYMSRVGE